MAREAASLHHPPLSPLQSPPPPSYHHPSARAHGRAACGRHAARTRVPRATAASPQPRRPSLCRHTPPLPIAASTSARPKDPRGRCRRTQPHRPREQLPRTPPSPPIRGATATSAAIVTLIWVTAAPSGVPPAASAAPRAAKSSRTPPPLRVAASPCRDERRHQVADHGHGLLLPSP
ncbi:Os11g0429000 [Oryza sativa Japonica Group]|uniref:Os11g0429000 protein n=2 Tax=Oryza sativa subsp. japonica TaxID=39947 RepID=C7J8H4_ORYSJ|nr:Os11g0429550 [Oryza sativa Japonica Group]BAT13804.1 Os11g0429000 [Oryza sativa Japonica Group]|eukprot:NP_001176507.1 Os11g0429550 [Oryza sativa Japonica Group]